MTDETTQASEKAFYDGVEAWYADRYDSYSMPHRAAILEGLEAYAHSLPSQADADEESLRGQILDIIHDTLEAEYVGTYIAGMDEAAGKIAALLSESQSHSLPGDAVSWPCETAVVNCDPVAVAKIVIKAGALEGPYIGGRKRPSQADVAFWDRVSAESERIAKWAVEGLGITGRAALTPPTSGEALTQLQAMGQEFDAGGDALEGHFPSEDEWRAQSEDERYQFLQRLYARATSPTSGEEMRLREALLPCDVTVAPITVFRSGVKVGTLLDCIEDRRAALTKGAE